MLVALAFGAILLWQGGVVGFDTDGEGVEIGTGGGGSGGGEGDGETTTTTEAPPTTVAPSSVKVVAANGAGISGLAGRTTEYLATQGYTTSVATDATASDVATTTIYYAEGFQPNAEALAAALGLPAEAVQALPPGAALADDQPVDAGLIIVLGADAVAALDATGAGGTATTAAEATETTAPG